MYFEVWKNNKLIRRGKKTLEPISFETELMYTPEFDLVLPIDWLECFDGWEEVKLYINGKCFYGLVWDLEPNKVDETLTVSCRHIISEWEHRQISVNHAMSDEALNIVYKGDEIEKNKANDETITASSFAVSAKVVDKLTLADWIEKASASAWKTSNGEPVAITSFDHKKFKKEDGSYEEGTYDFTFATAKGTEVTVDCEIKENLTYKKKKTNTSKTNREVISAKGFTADIDLGLTAAKVKKRIKAEAWVYKSNPKQEVAVTSITTDFVNEVGVYNVTASTANGTSVTVKVTIEDGTGYGDVDATVADKLEDIYNNMEFAYPGWQIEMQGNAGSEMIDYVYSKQNKLEALTQTMELTDNLFWRVGWWDYKKVEIGAFGKKTPYVLSTKPSGNYNIRIIEEPTIDYDFETVINVATVYSDKSDSGMASLTLREVYNDKSLQDDNFPVIILRGDVNNERDYSQYYAPLQQPIIAPNNELEYAVLDLESIALESGRLIEGSFAFNDLNPFTNYEESKRITNKKRIRAAQAVYNASKKKLIQNRRALNITLTVEELPADLLPGDRVRLYYDNSIWNIEACSSYYKKLLHMDDWFYVISIGYDIDENEVETNRITLCKWVKIDRDSQNI